MTPSYSSRCYRTAGKPSSSLATGEKILTLSTRELLNKMYYSVFQISLLIGFICVKNSPWTSYSASIYFEVVTMCDLIMILVFYFVYLFRAYRMLTCISWPLAELLHYLIGTLLLLIASIVTASKSYNSAGLVAGAVRNSQSPFQEKGKCGRGLLFPTL
uniref:CKLF like MARVEL transmembrane domain containing 7 n=1 Tax=Chelonoidis abingdonii TaxID=106734 RepID=A0A8C0HG23_CHEAB